jgi:SAM-dependent methyltransferase
MSGAAMAPSKGARDVNDNYRDPELGPILELAQPTPADTSLDCGCRAGQLAFALKPLAGTVEAVEDDADVLKEAERLATELRVTGIEFRHADLLELPYPAGRFTLIVLQQVLNRQVDPAGLLRECARVLAAGGRIVVSEVVVDEVIDRHFNELARLREPQHWRYHLAGEYDELFRDCGLRVVERRQVRRTVDLDFWIEAAQVSPRNAALVRSRVRALPVPVQVAMDVAFADKHVSFSYDVLVARLER